jgi:hypothetical protein
MLKVTKTKLAIASEILIFGIWFARLLTENFGVTYAIMPFFDIFCALLLLFGFAVNRYHIKNRQIQFLIGVTVVMFVIQIISIALNGNFFLKGWLSSFRSFYRLFSATLLGYLVYKLDDVDRLLTHVELLLFINALINTYQYFVEGISQDIIGGTFGNTQGVNEIQNVLGCVTLIWEILCYLNGKHKFSRLLLVATIGIYIAALAEITIYFFEIAIIVIFTFLLKTKRGQMPLNKKMMILIGSVLFLLAGVTLYFQVFPERKFLMSVDNIMIYLGSDVRNGNTGVYRISRIHPFQQLNNSFFSNNALRSIFGLGLGNCAAGGLFYSIWGPILHYNWLSSSMIFLENGYLGVIYFLFVLIYIYVYSSYSKTDKIKDVGFIIQLNFTKILSVLCLILFFYNSSLTDIYSVYLMGLIFGLTFVVQDRIKLDQTRASK